MAYQKVWAPFDIKKFTKENGELISKYMKKNTMELVVDDFSDLPETAFYKGNINLINGMLDRSQSYSLMQKLEYYKCAKDIVYFCEKYIKIISIDDGIIPFKPYQFQKRLLSSYVENRFNIAMQCRQSGKTATTGTFILHYSSFNPAKMSAVLAQNVSQAQEIMERIQMSYENLPKFLQAGTLVYNKRSMKLSNNSVIFSAASTSSSVRGKSCSLVYIDEAAFIPRDQEFYTGTYPVISSGKTSKIIMTSTPNGKRGLFYKLWCESQAKKNSFVNNLVLWKDVPGRDERWKRQTIENTSRSQFAQEYDCIFAGAQNSLIAGPDLEAMVVQPIIKEYGDVLVYQEPIKDHIYVMTCDVARGVGNDYSAFSIFDISVKPYQQVATYRNNKINAQLFANIIHSTAKYFNNSFTLIELNDLGEQTAESLKNDFEYENQLCTIKDKNKWVVGFGADSVPGVKTTKSTKPIGISALSSLISSKLIDICDSTTIAELGIFVPKGSSYAADGDGHDDTVMCLVLFGWLSTQSFFEEITKETFKQNIMGTLSKQEIESIVPFGIIDDDLGGLDSSMVSIFDDIDDIDPDELYRNNMIIEMLGYRIS